MSLPPLRDVAARLAPVAEGAAAIEARWLIEAAMGDPRRLAALVARRLAREPVDRIIGSRGFWTLDLEVGPAVLSPRSDTETVVRAIRDIAAGARGPDAPLRILDLGTGSGAILLALLSEFPNATGLGIDISGDALAIAHANAARTGLTRRAAFRTGDWCAGLAGEFDVIVSNPPYIPSGDIAGLDREVRDHDPRIALDGGPDGLDAYRRLMPALTRILASDGLAALEFGMGQGEAVEAIAAEAGLRRSEFHNDLKGVRRVIILNKI